ASSARQALEIFRDKSPNIVITDWLMPDFSGLELCRRIRQERPEPYTYIIVMTSKKEEDAVLRAMEAGADEFLIKPFNSNEMLARVGVGRRIIELHRKLEDKSAELEEVASTDVLTGLPNRRAIAEWANKQLRGAKRHGFPSGSCSAIWIHSRRLTTRSATRRATWCCGHSPIHCACSHAFQICAGVLAVTNS